MKLTKQATVTFTGGTRTFPCYVAMPLCLVSCSDKKHVVLVKAGSPSKGVGIDFSKVPIGNMVCCNCWLVLVHSERLNRWDPPHMCRKVTPVYNVLYFQRDAAGCARECILLHRLVVAPSDSLVCAERQSNALNGAESTAGMCMM